ncbi:MAG: lipase chaperone [Burkholderiales bacterium]|nr:lipase chaperone [Burkholderiales bacterium]
MAHEAPYAPPMPGAIPQSGWKAGGSADAPAPLALAELRHLFDQYLSSVDAQSVAVATQQIHAEMDRRLAPINVPKARRILGLYLEFKRELVNLERSPKLSGQDLHAVRQRIRAKHDLRARYFTAEEAQALFGSEDAYDMDAIARLEISQNPALTPEQKQEKLAALDAALPAMLRARQAPPPVLQVEEKVYALRTQGASDDDVYRLRAKEVDPQAAARLAALDHEEAQWTRRIAQYLTERNQLLETPETEADPDHKAALLDLQRTRFTEAERSRLSPYEQ